MNDFVLNKLIKKYGLLIALCFSLIIELTFGLGHGFINSIFASKNSPSIVNNNNLEAPVLKADDEIKSTCTGNTIINSTENKWEQIGYQQVPQGFKSVKDKELWPFMWYKNSIPSLFKSITYSAQLPADLDKTNPITIALGKRAPLVHIYFFENSLQIVGISKNVEIEPGVVEFTRSQPIELPELPLPKSSIVITITSLQNGDNTIIYAIKYEYVPKDKPYKTESHSFTVETLVPDPNLSRGTATTEFGIGTKTLGSFEPLSFQICE